MLFCFFLLAKYIYLTAEGHHIEILVGFHKGILNAEDETDARVVAVKYPNFVNAFNAGALSKGQDVVEHEQGPPALGKVLDLVQCGHAGEGGQHLVALGADGVQLFQVLVPVNECGCCIDDPVVGDLPGCVVGQQLLNQAALAALHEKRVKEKNTNIIFLLF